MMDIIDAIFVAIIGSLFGALSGGLISNYLGKKLATEKKDAILKISEELDNKLSAIEEAQRQFYQESLQKQDEANWLERDKMTYQLMKDGVGAIKSIIDE